MDIIEENEEDDNYELLERYFHEMKPKRVEFSQARVWIEIAKDLEWKLTSQFDTPTLDYPQWHL